VTEHQQKIDEPEMASIVQVSSGVCVCSRPSGFEVFKSDMNSQSTQMILEPKAAFMVMRKLGDMVCASSGEQILKVSKK
jgi:hypothetical protein